MSKLVIRKRVALDFLGEEYAEAYIDFKSVPVGDYDELLVKIKEAGDDNSKANATILGILKEYYIKGMFPNDSGKLEVLDSADELDNLDRDTLIECFGSMTGQDLKKAMVEKRELANSGAPQEIIDQVEVDVDPKLEAQSKPGSTEVAQPLENSSDTNTA